MMHISQRSRQQRRGERDHQRKRNLRDRQSAAQAASGMGVDYF